ncbi:hypothetical protein R80B4_02465 [Fibrobacteres bacterium R8-0-B4]
MRYTDDRKRTLRDSAFSHHNRVRADCVVIGQFFRSRCLERHARRLDRPRAGILYSIRPRRNRAQLLKQVTSPQRIGARINRELYARRSNRTVVHLRVRNRERYYALGDRAGERSQVRILQSVVLSEIVDKRNRTRRYRLAAGLDHFVGKRAAYDRVAGAVLVSKTGRVDFNRNFLRLHRDVAVIRLRVLGRENLHRLRSYRYREALALEIVESNNCSGIPFARIRGARRIQRVSVVHLLAQVVAVSRYSDRPFQNTVVLRAVLRFHFNKDVIGRQRISRLVIRTRIVLLGAPSLNIVLIPRTREFPVEYLESQRARVNR